MSNPETLPTQSADLTAEILAALRERVPQVFSESGVDFDKLKAALGAQIETGKERYGLTWAGKADAFRHVQTPSIGTLAPMPSDSVNWDSTENMIIEGDNLEVLKLLQRPYHGKVKMIYIDPPYNTGNEFIYPDNFREGLQDYLRYSGQVSEEGFAQTTNKDTSGRYHSNWLSMMYPRLFLARNLLREDGVIFVSIDDHEVHNLRHLMDEIFGEENFVAEVVWEGAGKNDARQIGINHEYVIVYGRNRAALPPEWSVAKDGVEPILREAQRLRTEFGDDYEAASVALAAWFRANKATPSFANRRFRYLDKNGVYKEDDPTAPGGRKFDLKHPRTGETIPLRAGRGWSFDQKEFERLVKEGRISFVTDTSIMVRRYLHETASLTPQSVIYQPARSASERLEKTLGKLVFDFPKDENVIRHFIEMSARDGLVLDFFAGSGTTAQAVLELNEKDGGNRKFILVQLPEKTDNPKFPTIAEITRERVRRVINRLEEKKAVESKTPKQSNFPQLNGAIEDEADDALLDLGFRAFRLTQSNFRVWDASAATDEATLKEQLALHADHVNGEASSMALLFEIMLRAGLPPSSATRRVEVPREGAASLVAHSVNDDELLVCVEQKLTLADMRALIALTPEHGRVVCLDRAFEGNDSIKTNAVNEAKSHKVTFYTA